MKIRNIIIIFMCLIMTGCSAQIQSLESESKARDQMERAEALEKAEAYHQAAQEYSVVAEHYPLSSYHKHAIWKAALLNIHPANPKTDYASALNWLKAYLKLPLSSDEKEAATLYVSMIEHISALEAELSSTVEEKEKLLKVTKKQSIDMEFDIKRRKELEDELAHAWDELNKMKAVDVRMHRSKVRKKVPPPSPPSPPAQMAQKKSEKGKTASKSSPQAPAKAQEFYPYMIQVSSYKNKQDSMREAMILRDKGDSVCISHARISGKGDWYRVLVGFYRTPKEAQQAVLELKKREYNNAFVVRRPFAVTLGNFSEVEKLKKLETHLISKGYSAYSLPNRTAKNKIRLLVGAFWTEKEATKLIKDLQKEGFKPKTVRR